MPEVQWQLLWEQSPWLLIVLVFVVSLAESLAIVGIIVPGVVLLTALSGAANWLGIDALPVITSAFFGAFLGDVASFYAGRLSKARFWHFRFVRRYEYWLMRGADFFERWGSASVFVGRFVGPVRPVLPLVAGLLAMPVGKFVLIDFLACLLWAPVYILPGFYVAHLTEGFWSQQITNHWQVLVCIGTFIVIGLMLKSLGKKR